MQGEATRSRLLAVAVDALEAGGEQAVKVREIASAMGVSVGAVYHHFQNREDLIVAARIAQFEGAITGDLDAIRAVVERAETVDELRAGVHFLTRAAHSGARAEYRRLRAEVAGVARHNPDLRAALGRVQNECTTALTEIVELAQRKGLGNQALDARSVATFVQAISLGLVLDDVNVVEPMDRDAWFVFTDQMYETLFRHD